MIATKPLPPHGAANPAATRARHTEYARTRNRLLAYGRWDPWTEAQPVRDHIAHLGEAGIGWMRAAELAGLPTATVGHWLYGHNGWPPPQKIHTEKAVKMLAVKADPENLADRALTDLLLTARQIHALAADGFPIKYVAERLGRDATNLSRIMRQSHVEVGTARAIAALFTELAGTDPAAAGISSRNAAYARNWAAKKGWAVSAAWDGVDMSDPDAFPDFTGRCGTAKGYQAHRGSGIPPCRPCKDAEADASAERKARRAEAARQGLAA